MARGGRLTRRALAGLALCLGLAVSGHVAVLAWWDSQQVALTSPLRGLPDPLFTRLIAPAEPVVAVAAPAPAPAPVTPAAPGVLRAALAEPALAAPPPTPPVSAAAPVQPASAPASTPASPPSPPPAAVAETPAAEVPPARPPSAAAVVVSPTEAATPAPSVGSAASAQASAPASAPVVANSADTWPPDARLTYRLEGQWRGGPLSGTARVQWQRQGTRYQAQVEIEIPPFVQRTLTSQGDVTPQGLVPRVYEERSRNRRRALQMGETDITLADGRNVPRPAGLQDTASQFVELGHRFATGVHALAVGEVITLPLARPGNVDTWTYDVIAQDRVTIPRLGEVVAWRLRPRPIATRRDNLSAEIWFAPSLQHLPVRIRIALGEEAELDLQVETLEQR